MWRPGGSIQGQRVCPSGSPRHPSRESLGSTGLQSGTVPAAGTWHGAYGCCISLLSLSPHPEALKLNEMFPPPRRLAHTATRQLLSDKEGVGGQARRQVGPCLPAVQLPLQHGSAHLPAGPEPLPLQVCARQALGGKPRIPGGGVRGCPSEFSVPAHFPVDFHLPTANAGLAHVPCASLHAGLSARSVASGGPGMSPGDDKGPPRVPASC